MVHSRAAPHLTLGEKPAGPLSVLPLGVLRLLGKEGGQLQGLSPMPTLESPLSPCLGLFHINKHLVGLRASASTSDLTQGL